MKKSMFLFTVMVMMSCLAEKSKKEEGNKIGNQGIELASKQEIKKIDEIFGEIDSTKIVSSIGCIEGYFGHISPKYVLRIPATIYNYQENIQEYTFDQNGLSCELLVFEQDSSHLANICTDIIIVNYPKPKRTIKSIGGYIKVYNGNPRELWGEIVNNTYIEIIKIEFIDSLENNQKIIVKDKIFWEVPYLGVPG